MSVKCVTSSQERISAISIVFWSSLILPMTAFRLDATVACEGADLDACISSRSSFHHRNARTRPCFVLLLCGFEGALAQDRDLVDSDSGDLHRQCPQEKWTVSLVVYHEEQLVVQLAVFLLFQHPVLSVELWQFTRASSSYVEVQCHVDLLALRCTPRPWSYVVPQFPRLRVRGRPYNDFLRHRCSKELNSCISRSNVAMSTVVCAVG